MKKTAQTMIPTYHDMLAHVSELLATNHSLSALYINCTRISKIERLCGKKIYQDIQKKVNSLILDMQGRHIRESDIIVSNGAGSDEFTIFLSAKRKQEDFCASDLESLCERVTEYLNKSVFPITFPYLRGGPKITVGYAVIIHNPLMRDERLLNKLMEDARLMAQYHEFKRIMRYKEKLQELILKESITTVYQPVVDFTRNEIIGYEALTRGPEWTEFENPYALFDAAAESELLFELDQLCRKKALLNARGLESGMKLFVNCLPSVVLDPEFRDSYIQTLLDGLMLSPKDIVFEITEREAIENYDLFNKAVKYYTDLGFAIAVDDTGAGFSSLETVVELKPQYIKLDLSIVRGIHKNMIKQELIKAIQSMSRQMDSHVIAEGIQTEEELEVLKDIGITLGQGFLFAKPGRPFPQINRR